ncbi:hypothetical protein AN1V17_33520 [Vallitalea sediminicola]
MLFGDRLKKLRIDKEITQKELGEIIGISDRVIGYYESNNRFPKDEDTLKRISKYFNVSIDYLLGNNHNDTSSNQPLNSIKIDKKLDNFIEEIEKTNGLMFSGSEMDEQTKEVLLKMLKTTKDMAEKMNENNKK